MMTLVQQAIVARCLLLVAVGETTTQGSAGASRRAMPGGDVYVGGGGHVDGERLLASKTQVFSFLLVGVAPLHL